MLFQIREVHVIFAKVKKLEEFFLIKEIQSKEANIKENIEVPLDVLELKL